MFYYTKESSERSKILRRKQTPREKHLWYDYLNKHTIKFQRQKPIDNYILDFYCAKAKLVIEVDGKHHYNTDNIEYDQRRTGWLEKYGIIVRRFSNEEIDRQFYSVCRSIDRIVNERIEELEKNYCK